MAATDKITQPLSQKQAFHLLRRATFGPSKEDVKAFTGLTIDAAMDLLFTDTETPEPPILPGTEETWLNPKAGDGADQDLLTDYFMSWQLELMLKSGATIKEKLTFFYHAHMPTRKSLIFSSEAIYYQNALYRYYALGSFKTMFRKLCLDNAMLKYLDGTTNIDSSPNENFAREMFELYSIGRGDQIEVGNYTNYTEDDIKAATRILTGWTYDEDFVTLDPDTGIPTGKLSTYVDGLNELANKHDAEEKVFSAAFGNKTISPAEIIDDYATKQAAEGEVDEMIDMIFDQNATAEFLVRKLYRFFVYHDISESVETNVIGPLAAAFKASDYDMPTLIKMMLSSEHFFDVDNGDVDDDNVGAIIKSPIDLTLGTIRMFNVAVPNIVDDPANVYNMQYRGGIIPALNKQGLNWYEPFEVAGYPAYHQFPGFNRNWITPNALAYRFLFGDLIINGVNYDDDPWGMQIDSLTWFDNPDHISDPSNANALIDELLALMVPFTVAAERRAFFKDSVLLDGIYDEAWATEWNTYKANASNESTIKQRLDALIVAIIKSPEFQLL